jgi:hypothetical protein
MKIRLTGGLREALERRLAAKFPDFEKALLIVKIAKIGTFLPFFDHY